MFCKHLCFAGLIKSRRDGFNFNDECLLLFVRPAAAVAAARELVVLSVVR